MNANAGRALIMKLASTVAARCAQKQASAHPATEMDARCAAQPENALSAAEVVFWMMERMEEVTMPNPETTRKAPLSIVADYVYWRWYFTSEWIEARMKSPKVNVHLYWRWRTFTTRLSRFLCWVSTDCGDCRRPTTRFGRHVGDHTNCYDPPF